tara:strand:+ start:191 stop:685 length:495 start_codon:yes stop_codon:yes gene_type:complete
MRKLMLIAVFTCCTNAKMVSAEESKAVQSLDVLMRNQRVEVISMEQAKAQQAKFNKDYFSQAKRAYAQGLKKVKQPTGKVIHLAHEKINKVNFTDKFVVRQIDAQKLALGATGIASLKQQPDVKIYDLDEDLNTKVNAEDKTPVDKTPVDKIIPAKTNKEVNEL